MSTFSGDAATASSNKRKGGALFLVATASTDLQQETEEECEPFFINLSTLTPQQSTHLQEIGLLQENQVCLLYDKHEEYLLSAITSPLKPAFVSLDASRTWILYWTLHSLDLLGKLPNDEVLSRCVDTLKACWSDHGFGGGPGQLAHGATTYAAVSALAIIATTDGESSQKAMMILHDIRNPLLQWFLSLIQANGGFSIHDDGETDVRATYTILSVASLLNIMTDDLTKDAVDYLLQCQTYEGGFGGEPGSEAHGGYTYCAVATLEILGSLERCNLSSLTSWLARRQMTYEGGFSGRSNKLVDGCYSFWQGGAVAIVSSTAGVLFEEGMLQRYILLCAQDVYGGLRDKPSKGRDFYHSCYNLSGLSISQHYGSHKYGHISKSRVNKTHPCFNIRVERVEAVQSHFSMDIVQQEE